MGLSSADICLLQGLPLSFQIERSQQLIHEAMEHFGGKAAVSFSGGKDSAVLLHLVRSLYPDVPAVFVNTGLEFPENVRLVRQTDNVIWLQPKTRFKEVIERHGYPVVSKEIATYIWEVRHTSLDHLKHKRLHGNDKGYGKISNKWMYLLNAPFEISAECCHIMKRSPLYRFERESKRGSFVGTMAFDSRMRMLSVMKHGCNAFSLKRPQSRPMATWTENHVWEYIRAFNVPYSSIYDMGYTRTGCMYCMFGLHMEGRPNRFDRMKETHPKMYRYCIEELGIGKILEWYPERGYVPQQRMFA